VASGVFSVAHEVYMQLNINNTNVKTFCSSYDELAQYEDQIVIISLEGTHRSIAGRVIGLSDSYVTLEKKDGRRALIRRKAISAIEPIKEVV
jgi:hypothetical protein